MSLPFYLLSRRSRKQAVPTGRQGFSLIEMLVVLTIFIIMLGVVLANFPAFRDKTALQLIAQEIATTIRQAQVYGIGTRAAEVGAGAQFSSHGIYFNLDLAVGGDKKTLVLYADKKNLDSSPPGVIGFSDEGNNSVVEKFAIRGAAEMSDLCDESTCGLQTLDILFQRFYPEASFPGLSPVPSYVKIVLKSTRADEQKWIKVWNTGQISVENP